VEHAIVILVAMGAGMQTVNLFLAGYLMKRVDQCVIDLREHERRSDK